MYVHLRPRLARAADMLGHCSVVADIGSDHGRLAVALLQQARASQVIASDISHASLEKARSLSCRCGLEGRIEFRVADGLNALLPGEVDGIIIAGMGGLLMARILQQGDAAARAAKRIVLQPQGNAAELRAFLYENGYNIESEAIEFDNGRYYQLIGIKSGTPRPIPALWPAGYLDLGPVACENNDPLLLPLARKYRAGHHKRLQRARKDGYEPAILLAALEALDTIIALLEDQNEA